MKNYRITVNGIAYDVTVEERPAGAAAPAPAPAAPAAPAPAPAPAAAAPAAAEPAPAPAPSGPARPAGDLGAAHATGGGTLPPVPQHTGGHF